MAMDHRPVSPRRAIPSWVPQVLAYAASAVCLAVVLHNYPTSELIPAVRALDWRWVFLAVVSELAVYVTQAWRWNTLLNPVARLGLWRTVQAIYVGLFADIVLPLRPGEVIRVFLLTHWNDLRISLGFASWAVERLIDGLWLLVTFFLTAGFVRGIPRHLVMAVQVMGALLILGCVALTWIVLHKQETHIALGESRWSATLRHVLEGLHLMGNRRTMTYTTLISLLFLFVQIIPVWALMKAYGLDLSFWAAAGVITIVRIGTVVPNAPGNVGVIQLACVVALGVFDVERNDAKTFSFIYLAATTLPLLIGGAVATALTGVNIGELKERAKRFEHAPHAGQHP
jgi:glycosyltransferase 2 family protein